MISELYIIQVCIEIYKYNIIEHFIRQVYSELYMVKYSILSDKYIVSYAIHGKIKHFIRQVYSGVIH